MFIYPVPQGTWSIEISCEGYQATSSTTDPHRGKSDGMIAYDDDQTKVWNVGVQNNVTISNNKADADWKYGHPNLTINGERFDQNQVVEKDGTVSFHLVTTGPNASFFLVGPPVKKIAKYNYCISYGAWTDRDMEFGMVSVVLDEHLEGVRGSQYVRKTLRPGHISVNRTHRLQEMPPMREDFSEEDNSSSDSNTYKTDNSPLTVHLVKAGDEENYTTDRSDDVEPTLHDADVMKFSGFVGAKDRFTLQGADPIGPGDRSVRRFRPSATLKSAFHSGPTPDELYNAGAEQADHDFEHFVSRGKEKLQDEDPMAKLEREAEDLKPDSDNEDNDYDRTAPMFNPADGDPWSGIKIKPRLKDQDMRSTLSTGTLKGGSLKPKKEPTPRFEPAPKSVLDRIRRRQV
uniref:Minor capsid protein n=1 Tax=Soybean dwarf virus TaxID=12049 RepID=A0A7H1KWB4_9TOMB|nr:Minor capsid protein [Soybean dwarf virus]QNT38504.1 Minor capsid protein [Soybean dwarf virus]